MRDCASADTARPGKYFRRHLEDDMLRRMVAAQLR
jgi:hypothetical protein